MSGNRRESALKRHRSAVSLADPSGRLGSCRRRTRTRPAALRRRRTTTISVFLPRRPRRRVSPRAHPGGGRLGLRTCLPPAWPWKGYAMLRSWIMPVTAATILSVGTIGVVSIASAAPRNQPDITTAQTFTVLAHATNFKMINLDGKDIGPGDYAVERPSSAGERRRPQPSSTSAPTRPPRKASGSSTRRRSPRSPCASPSCRRGMSRPQSTPSRSSTTSPGWDSLSGGSRREKPGTLGRSDPANPDFWIFAGLTRAPTHNGRHAAADPRLHDQELQGVGYPYLRYPVQATSALGNLAVSLCPSVNRAVRTCATREQDPSIPPLTCEFPGSVGSITPRPGSPTAITWPGTRRGRPTYG
jgi:hypothetical protein